MKTLKIGIIGAGRIGRVHAASITNNVKNAEVVAISDVFVESAKKAAEEFGIPKYCADYKEILNDKSIDAVLICSPTPTHSPISIEAARAGKHIFCEKPVDLCLDNIREVKKVVEETGVKMQIGFNRRFDHNFRHINKLAKDGKLGNIQIVKITSRDPEPPSPEYAASSGGMFVDMTIHDFDMARYQTMSECVEVYAKGAVLVDPAIGKAGDIDTALITLTMANGALVNIDNCRKAVYGYDQRVEVFGSEGCAVASNDTDTNVSFLNGDAVTSDKPLFFFLERYMQSFGDEMKMFVDACLEDKPVPVGIDDGFAPVAIAIAAKKSLDEGRPVKVAEVL